MTDKTYFIGERILKIQEITKLKQGEFADMLGVSAAWISRLERNKGKAGEQLIKSISHTFNVNPAWLRDGIGEMGHVSLPEERSTSYAPTTEPPEEACTPSPSYGPSPGQAEDVSRKMIKIMTMVMNVLESNTHYAESLEKNIFSFHAAVEEKKDLTGRIEALERIVRHLEKKKDPPEPPPNFPESGAQGSTMQKRKKRPGTH